MLHMCSTRHLPQPARDLLPCGAHAGLLRSAHQPAQARPRGARNVAAAAAAGTPAAQPQRAVVILPGLGNNAKDYTALSSQLASRQLHVEVASVARLDW